jgi:GT2 family glycosyltransferase
MSRLEVTVKDPRPELAIVLGTYNRLALLRECLGSLRAALPVPHVVHVTDAGSTDGTVEYLARNQSPTLVAHLIGRPIGQARALNDVFAQIRTPYVCWISDDNVLLPGALKRALAIIRGDARIGMVALKVKDVVGPFVEAPYIGGISSIGILNVNQGLLPTGLLQRLGGFSEEYRDYGIDPDLTARVLFAGYRVVYTKHVCIHHHRQWATAADPEGQRVLKEKQARSLEVYDGKYRQRVPFSRSYQLKLRIWRHLEPRLLAQIRGSGAARAARRHRDLLNAFRGRFIRVWDSLACIGCDCHLVQIPPAKPAALPHHPMAFSPRFKT